MEKLKRELNQVEKEIENILNVIRGGLISDSLKDALVKAEANKSRVEGLLRGNGRDVEKVLTFLPRAVDRYTEMLNNLTDTLQRVRSRSILTPWHLILAEAGEMKSLCRGGVALAQPEIQWPTTRTIISSRNFI